MLLYFASLYHAVRFSCREDTQMRYGMACDYSAWRKPLFFILCMQLSVELANILNVNVHTLQGIPCVLSRVQFFKITRWLRPRGWIWECRKRLSFYRMIHPMGSHWMKMACHHYRVLKQVRPLYFTTYELILIIISKFGIATLCSLVCVLIPYSLNQELRGLREQFTAKELSFWR